jgi:hypothetical protein
MAAYNLIGTTTVGSGGAASIDFTSIPQTYTDLAVVMSARIDGGTIYGDVQTSFNSDTTAANYSWRNLTGNGAATSSETSSSGNARYCLMMAGSGTTSNTFGNGVLYIPNYAGSTYKSFSSDSCSENNASTSYLRFFANLWSSTSAITSISFSGVGNNFLQYSSASLYGIKNS